MVMILRCWQNSIERLPEDILQQSERMSITSRRGQFSIMNFDTFLQQLSFISKAFNLEYSVIWNLVYVGLLSESSATDMTSVFLLSVVRSIGDLTLEVLTVVRLRTFKTVLNELESIDQESMIVIPFTFFIFTFFITFFWRKRVSGYFKLGVSTEIKE